MSTTSTWAQYDTYAAEAPTLQAGGWTTSTSGMVTTKMATMADFTLYSNIQLASVSAEGYSTAKSLEMGSQINFDTALTAGQILQIWWSPKWATSTGDVYTNIMCEVSGTTSYSYDWDIRNTATDLVIENANKNAAATFSSGTSYYSSWPEYMKYVMEWDATKKGRFYCITSRDITDVTTGIANIAIGDTISYIGGAKLKPNANATTVTTAATGAITTAFTYTIMDSAAVALTATLATIMAVQTLTF